MGAPDPSDMHVRPTISMTMIYLTESFPDTIITRSVIMRVCFHPRIQNLRKHTEKRRTMISLLRHTSKNLEHSKREYYTVVQITNKRPLAAG